ncbi:sensor histidine kinase [Deinococcus maricopensis]|uniref:histidine kinase n=1 Tax=Deinococcus maricopensis (strain DSM 21211 / LMG 22137 / NRRL B-23946 / LB-34) TaxID=709986 RepID=E8U3C4_DEIML|nr:ATP-binding protein [Deinococcus maricopensis]ADV65795.1 PAS/PAC sensor signal transduction histidine kinase [Deinococcus maricopensis DSM 21211]
MDAPSPALAHAALDALSDALFLLDAADRVTYMNGAAARAFPEVTPGALLTETLARHADLPHDPEDGCVWFCAARAQVLQWRAQALPGGRSVQVREVSEAPSGDAFAVMLDSLPDPLYVQGRSGVQRLNAAARTLFGVPTGAAADVLTPPLYRDARTGEVFPPGAQPVQRALRGERLTQEVQVWVGDEARHVRLAAAPLWTDGAVRAAVVTLTDWTDRQQARALRRAYTQLERRMEARTARIVELNAELTAYGLSLSRDLREPLRRIDGFLTLARKRLAGVTDERTERYFEVIRDETSRLNQLVEDLVALSHAGKAEMQVQDVPLGQLVMQVRSDLAPLMVNRRITWRIDALPTVPGDWMLLRLAVTNLLHNAIKFTQDEPEAVIAVQALVRPNEVVVSVRDNGVGFAPERAEEAFGLFVRLNETFEGAGLGLANVRRVIARHGGRVWAEGRPGEGATFFFTLPLGA